MEITERHFYSFDNDGMKSSKHHAVLLSLIYLLKFSRKSHILRAHVSGLFESRLTLIYD